VYRETREDFSRVESYEPCWVYYSVGGRRAGVYLLAAAGSPFGAIGGWSWGRGREGGALLLVLLLLLLRSPQALLVFIVNMCMSLDRMAGCSATPALENPKEEKTQMKKMKRTNTKKA
jgi:hypothetical protein